MKHALGPTWRLVNLTLIRTKLPLLCRPSLSTLEVW